MRAPPDEADAVISSLALDDDSDEESTPLGEREAPGAFRSATADSNYY